MGRAPCCDKANVKKGPWSPEEDAKLKDYIGKHGTGGNWIALPQKAGLRRCGKSCRLRWLNYLRPNIKHGEFSDDEDRIICSLFATIGSRWSIIAAQLPGRTDNDIKNYWNTKLKKKLMGLVPSTLIKRPIHQATIYPSILSLLQTTTPPSSFSYTQSSSPPPAPPPAPYDHSTNNGFYTNNPTATSFTSCDIQQPISVPSCFLSTLTTINLQTQEGYVEPLHSFQANKESSTTLLMFGGDQASCSSSDGSWNNQISHGKDAEYEYGCHVTNGDDHQQMGLQSYHNYMTAGVVDDGLYGETVPLDYGLEEIKQLITTNACSNFNPFC